MIIIQKRALFLLLSIALTLACSNLNPKKHKVLLAGDSTMSIKLDTKRPETGWGEKLPLFFSKDLQFINYAKNGRSTKTFISEGIWEELLNNTHKGDIVIIQFGHNDGSKKKVERYTPPEVYKANLSRFVDEVRGKEATPVLCTPIVRRRFNDDNEFYDTHGVYPDLVRSVCGEKNVSLLDMHKSTQDLLIRTGADASKALFLWLEAGHANYPDGLIDNTHLSDEGAYEVANLAAKDLLAIKRLGFDRFKK